ncbi:FAD-dependent monooxygenase [Bacillus aquiflavi]|uniref:FAD-binding protein n=1 Tax=Bacillus aquiflavi TaxID=2672567 RepID=A0A6B3VTY1_9BACI|nr:FAD-dependent monooxygenase [Bacillus aquiflavi]MBA4537495.1 FAD-dependent monooxygenase [Bacillus aquiflavi]NEY81750.1 FAD-binding protein [Bacillus aquiflavi]UAC47460.1 FAD-dependent monooxygenase [Bacillus aquiflavi]
MSEKKSRKIIIVGGGIGGLAAALGMAETGRKSLVLERAPEFSEVGAGIQLAPNGTAVLERLGVMDEISKLAVFPKRLVLMDAITGKELTALNLEETFKNQYGHPYIVMHRADLHKVLYEACLEKGNITLLTNSEVEKVEDLTDRAKVTLVNGDIYESDAVIGADGIHSNTRKLVSDDQPVCSQYVAYRGTIPMEEVTETAGTNPDDVLMWIGPNLHLVQYPVRRGELYNQVVVFKSFKYKPGADDWKANDWGTPEEMDERFANTCPFVKHSVSFISRQFRWAMWDRDPIQNWTKGRVTLLGDAAHPMLQYMAQGGIQALEDVAHLTSMIHKYGDDYTTAFLEYQKERIPRASKVQTYARNWGEIIHAEDPISIMLRNDIFSKRGEYDFTYVDWLYSKRYESLVSL